MKRKAVLELAKDLLIPSLVAERKRLTKIDDWLRQPDTELVLPRRANREHKALRTLSQTPLLGTVVTVMSQGLFVDGFRAPDAHEDADGWRTWQANDFETRQSAIHRAALSYGTAYVTVMPGLDRQGNKRSVMRGVSPRKMIAVYQDAAGDDWPMYALRAEPSKDKYILQVIDEEKVYFVGSDASFTDLEWLDEKAHDSGECPVVRYTNLLDLEGRADGEVETLIPIAARHQKTTYDRLLTQHFNSWKVRTIAGLEDEGTDPADTEERKMRLRQEDMLVADNPETKFGTLDETPLEGFIKAGESDKDDLSSTSQIPSTVFGHSRIANMSADTVAELRAGLNQKLFERKASLGKSHQQALGMAHIQETGEEPDYMARMLWRDMSPASMGQVLDGLGKAVTMLDVPAEGVWHLIPGVSRADIADWSRLVGNGAAREALSAIAAAAQQSRQVQQQAAQDQQ